MYDAYLVEHWWHTATVAAFLHNLQVIVVNALGGRRKLKPKSPRDLHPYLKPRPDGFRITRANISVLKMIGNALCKHS